MTIRGAFGRMAWMENFLEKFYFLIRISEYCRFSLAVLVFGVAVLFVTGQGRELTVRLTDHSGEQILFVFGALIWAWEIWYWSRLILDRKFFPDDAVAPELESWSGTIVSYLPRIIGGLALVAAVFAAGINNVTIGVFPTWIILTVIGAASFTCWYYLRRPAGTKWASGDFFSTLAMIIRILSRIILAGLAVWALTDPLSFGSNVGAAAIVFFALVSIAVVGNFLVYVTSDHGFPLLLLFLILGVLFSAFGWSDNHGVRQLNAETHAELKREKGRLDGVKRQAPVAAYKEWKNSVSDKDPLVVVVESPEFIGTERV